MLTCRELTELVTDYLEGRMPTGQRLRFRLHVAMCPSCRTYLRQMELTVQSLGELPEEDIPEGVRDDLMNAFQSWKKDGPDA